MFKLIAPGAAMIAVNYAFARFSYGLFLPYISDSLNLSESEAGLIGTLGYISYSIALICSNIFIDKFGPLKVTQLAGLSAVIGLLGIALSANYFLLGVSMFTAGLGSGWSSPAFSKLVDRSFPEDQKDQGNSWINSGTTFGIIISGPIALFFAEYWRNAFLFFALLAFATLIWNSMVIPNPETSQESSEKRIPAFQKIIKNGLRIIIDSMIVGFSSSVFWTFSRSYLTAEHGFSNQESVLFWILMGIAGIAGGIVGKVIVMKGLNFSFRLFLSLLILSIALIIFPSRIMSYTAAVFFGIAYIAITGLLLVWGTKRFSDTPFVGVSLSFFCLGIGQTIGSTVAGMMIEMISYPFTFGLFALFGLMAFFVRVKE
ncbi:MFS transporter [Marinilactibacillus psychrotolerans]|uniref:MFS transporter n=1 Tax=Marinilactibacillus psychrotolerans TaxID=191770 RepID=A0AAV3WRI3_9LACT|nr:MFS transporter [Marinilactibacillus psychrotolerans]GEL68106.1 MFS transporter [Marinilactibacillus psychrotolerans]GEQ36559.1 MFS transporter [Marinilactibacillus psychrotolerans]SDD40541.1 Predicted arabinose efflux permease, MFS family [Marinilactibacillus psychrotolerans]